MLTLLLAPLLLSPTLAQGEEAPDLALPDLGGEVHRLSDQAGRVVVLEWTSHLCPSVARATETRLIADTRAAVRALGEPGEVVWWQVDSSWFAPELADAIRAWKRRTGSDVPLLLDADGGVARAYGATTTPEIVVVDPEGGIAYRGALTDGADEGTRRNPVVEAVRAILAGDAPPRERVDPSGCTIKLRRPAGMRAEDWDEDAAANEAYRRAVRAIEAGEPDRALEELEAALGKRLPTPWRARTDPTFAPLFADPGHRETLRSLLEAYPARGSLAMVTPAEPGEPMVLSGSVRDEDGEPIKDAVVTLYHTDADGWYAPGTIEGKSPRLSGAVRTDRQGRYRIRTIVPGHYHGAGGPAHVHFGVRAEGFRPHVGHRASIYFQDDEALTGASREEIVSDGCSVLPRARNAEGATLVVNDVVLTRDRAAD